jgi:hypothetical protein
VAPNASSILTTVREPARRFESAWNYLDNRRSRTTKTNYLQDDHSQIALQKENETFVPCDHQGGETELAFNSMSHELAGTSGGGADHKACRGVKVTRQVEVSDALIAVLKDLRRPHWQASVWRMVVLERLDELLAFAKKVAKPKTTNVSMNPAVAACLRRLHPRDYILYDAANERLAHHIAAVTAIAVRVRTREVSYRVSYSFSFSLL